MLGHDLFVGRDNVLAMFDRPQNQRSRRFFTADDLDHHVHLRIVDDPFGLRDDGHAQAYLPWFCQVADEDGADLNRATDAAFEGGRLRKQDASNSRTHRTQPEQPDPERGRQRTLTGSASACAAPGTECAASAAMLAWRGETFQNCPR